VAYFFLSKIMKHQIAEINISYSPNKLNNGIKITSSDKAYEVILNNWKNETIELYEEFKVLLLNNSNEVLGIYTISRGGYTGTMVDMRILFAVILKSAATAIITVHNHPSGTLKPSQADIKIYKKIKEISKLHDINCLDNLIITKNGKLSFTDEQL
jgi:DNA repair protein RadC